MLDLDDAVDLDSAAFGLDGETIGFTPDPQAQRAIYRERARVTYQEDR